MKSRHLVSFGEYKEASDVVNEATVNASKYGPGSLFVLKGAKADTFSKKISSAIKLPKNPVFSKLDPNNVPDTAVVIGDSSKPLQAAFDILDGPEGKSAGVVAWYDKSVNGYYNNLKLGSDINWGGETPTLETCQAIGVYYKDVESDVDDRAKVIDNIKSILGNGQDWDSKGVSKLLPKLDTMSSKNFAEMVALISGMADFTKAVVSFKPNIIHGRINDYYKAEEQNDKVEITGVKANTADMIVSSASADATIVAMASDTFTFDNKGIITGNESKIKMIQVSLKKSATGAQIGKAASFIIKKYGLPGYNDYFVDVVGESLHEGLMLNEGPLDLIKRAANVVKSVWSKVSGLVKKFFSKILSMMKKANELEKKKVFKKYEKVFGLDSKEIALLENVIEDKEHLTEAKESLNAKLKKIDVRTANKLVKDVRDKKTGIVKVFDGKDYLVQRSGKPISEFKSQNEIDFDDVSKLLSNSYSISCVNSILGSTNPKDVIDSVVDMHKEVYFGKTSLPLYKVYGKSSGPSYEYLGTAEDFSKKKKEKLSQVQFPVAGLRLTPINNRYLNIDFFVVSDVSEDEIYYTQFRTGTNATGKFSFNFEGTKQITSTQFKKFLS